MPTLKDRRSNCLMTELSDGRTQVFLSYKTAPNMDTILSKLLTPREYSIVNYIQKIGLIGPILIN